MDTITKPVLTASLLLLPLALPAGLENDILPLFGATRRSLPCVNHQSDVRLVSAPVKTSSQLPNNWCGSGIQSPNKNITIFLVLCDVPVCLHSRLRPPQLPHTVATYSVNASAVLDSCTVSFRKK